MHSANQSRKPASSKGDRPWLIATVIAGVVVDVTLNKYSGKLPGLILIALWGVVAGLFIVWIWRVEKTQSWVKARFLEHPVSYIFMFLVLVPFGWQATATMLSNFHLQKMPTTGSLQSVGTVIHAPSSQSQPAVIASTPTVAPNRLLIGKKKRVPGTSLNTVHRSGEQHQQNIASGVTQSSLGECSPNVIGNGNTTNTSCEPKQFILSNEQEQAASKVFQAQQLVPTTVDIIYEWSALDGKDAANQLQHLLSLGGVSSSIGNAGMYMVYVGAPSYAGLSFANVTDENQSVADALEKALRKVRAIEAPIRRLAGTGRGDRLTIIIRKA